MNVLLLSNGKIAGNTNLLEFGYPWIKPMIEKTEAKRILFIPYAMIRGDYDERTQLLNESLGQFGCEVTGIHTCKDPVAAIAEYDGIVVSGGNTWVLNKMLHDLGLVRPIRNAILKEKKLYIGWSAGTNIASPTIRTTNDMPIVTAAILPALNIIPFQINPHYIEASVSGHMGETRDERIQEFLIMNPSEFVVAIPEGSLLKLEDDQLSYHAAENRVMKVFSHEQPTESYNSDSDLTEYLNHGC
ncbi:dipeptidase PepE [Vibrio lamellibrachiae]|uniref:dipeptidase PepE n=1 Tax=Vibrio lamellibrachiae TaxID=2910253 RepID=UPI003D11FFAD